MSLYIIEDRYGALRDSSVNYNYAKSVQQSRYPDCHIVELVPAKPKVKVSQEEADMLERAKHPTFRPSYMITEYSNSHKGNILGNDLEDRLMSAYVNGWKVEKESKYLVWVKLPDTGAQFYKERLNGQPRWERRDKTDLLDTSWYQFTKSEVEQLKYDYPYIEIKEVTDDEV